MPCKDEIRTVTTYEVSRYWFKQLSFVILDDSAVDYAGDSFWPFIKLPDS